MSDRTQQHVRPALHRDPRPLVLVATVITVAVIATLVIGTHVFRQSPVPAHSTAPPAPRSGAAVAYDEARGEMVLFGGVTGSGVDSAHVNETWTWDGKYWTHQHPAASPWPADNGVMTYDAARRDVVLAVPLGVNDPSATWTWNGSSWRRLYPAHSPKLGYAWQPPTMQFDEMTRTVLLFGFSPDYLPETWSWDGSDWKRLNTGSSPTGPATMVSIGGQPLLLAGTPGPVNGRFFTQTWAWDGSSWNLLHPTVELPNVGVAASAYDAARHRVVVLTGDTWTWDGSTWTRQHPMVQPPTVGYTVYMSSLHEVVSWGSQLDTTDGEMYGWDGTNWTLIQPGPRPEPTNGKGGYLGSMTPPQAAAIVRSTVKNSHPVLLPASLPGSPWDATVDSSSGDDFGVIYQSDQRDKTLLLELDFASPPPGGTSSSDTYVKFRDSLPLKYHEAGYAEYFVYDPSNPLSQRWLTWIEPGSSPWTKSGVGAPYFLSADGLTDQEFWQVANSLQ